MIKINFKDGKKFINNRDVVDALKDFNDNVSDYKFIKKAFELVNSEEDLINLLKLEKSKIEKTRILLYIKVVTNSSISGSQEIFNKIYDTEFK